MLAFPKRHAIFRFYAELNDFLLPTRRSIAFVHNFELPASAKDKVLDLFGVDSSFLHIEP